MKFEIWGPKKKGYRTKVNSLTFNLSTVGYVFLLGRWLLESDKRIKKTLKIRLNISSFSCTYCRALRVHRGKSQATRRCSPAGERANERPALHEVFIQHERTTHGCTQSVDQDIWKVPDGVEGHRGSWERMDKRDGSCGRELAIPGGKTMSTRT